MEFTFYDKEAYRLKPSRRIPSFQVYSDSDKSGLEISVEQYNNERYKKPFFFYLSSDDESSGDTLFAKPGDKIYVEWEDYTLPKDAEGKIGGPYQKGDHLDIIDVATITR